jgi:hypothetical protein
MTPPGTPLDHVYRAALPWRDDQLTECGRSPEESRTITADELAARIKHDGIQRTAYSVCNTCLERAKNSARLGDTWMNSPISVLNRELQRVGPYRPPGHPLPEPAARMTRELHAIAALITAHREEFDDYLAGAVNAVDLAQARARRRSR